MATRKTRRRGETSKAPVFFFVLASLSSSFLSADERQELVPGATVVATPGRQYGAGGLHRLFFGGHYRGLWTTPLRVEVLDLGSFAGGLTPIKRGGGRQSQTLRMKGGDGRQYAFRSIDKDPSAVLSEAYRKTFVAGIVRDQVSSQHPVAPLVVAPLLEAAGVLHAQPRLAVLPDDPRLGEFRKDFGGMFGMIEERPDDASLENPGFFGASEVVNSDSLFKRLEKNPRHRIDARAFLKARLFDMYVGDWDRHADQWRWACFDERGLHIWRPIPKDRDQAFARFDGLVNRLVALYQPTIVTFRDHYPAISRLAWSGRVLDRRLLSELDWPAWEDVAMDLKGRLTDAVIAAAVAHLPPEYQERSGPELIRALKRRRDRLPQAALDFFEILVGEVDVHATDEPEIAVAEHKENGEVEVRLYPREGDAEAPQGDPFFRRRFDPRKTREIRLYLHGGDDRFVIPTTARERITVRVIGGGGDDDLRPSAARVGGSRARTYEGRAEGRKRPQQETGHREEPIPLVVPLPVPPRDWGRQTAARFVASFNPDIGVYLDGGLVHTRYAFRQVPYRQRHTLHAGYATGASGGRAEYTGDFRFLGRSSQLGLFARGSNIEIIRFSGFGNETPAPTAERQKVRQEQYVLRPFLVLRPSGSVELSVGPHFLFSKTEPEAGTVLGETRPYGLGRFSELGGAATLRLDTRNRPIHATRGLLLDIGGSLHPPVFTVKETFGEIHGEGAAYLTAGLPGEPTLALRAGGKKLWGTYPFFEAATVGGKDSVRGFEEQRFFGDAALYGNAELRLFLARFQIFSPGDFGVFFLGDAGRVFLDGEDSKKWHTSFGGGIWLSFVERRNTVSLAVVRSPERTAVYARAGFVF